MERICGLSCQCINCMNTPTHPQAYVNDSDDDDLQDLTTDRDMEIMHFVFGEDEPDIHVVD